MTPHLFPVKVKKYYNIPFHLIVFVLFGSENPTSPCVDVIPLSESEKSPV